MLAQLPSRCNFCVGGVAVYMGSITMEGAAMSLQSKACALEPHSAKALPHQSLSKLRSELWGFATVWRRSQQRQVNSTAQRQGAANDFIFVRGQTLRCA